MKVLKDSKVMKKFWIVINIIIFGIIIFLQPLFMKTNIINNDTLAHLQAFERHQYIYFGQQMIGEWIDFVNRITGVNIGTLFLWFNFISLFCVGLIVLLFTYKLTKSWVAGIIGMWLMVFGIGATQHLFWSGTIFNIIDILIIFPIVLLLINKIIEKRFYKGILLLIPMTLFLVIFHPSFGIGVFTNIGKENVLSPAFIITIFIGIPIIIIMIIGFYLLRHTKIKLGILIVDGILIVLSGIFIFLSYSNITAFSSRLAMNLSLMIGLLSCIMIGLTFKNSNSQSAWINRIIIGLSGVAVLPNLIQWIGKY